MPSARHIGQAVAAARKARRLAQPELARRAAISLSLLRKIEQGRRTLTPEVREALGNVLGPIPDTGDRVSASDSLRSALPVLSELMDGYDIPAEPSAAPHPLPELRRATETATFWRLSSQYSQLAGLVPGLISDLTATAFASTGHEQEQAFGLLALAWRAADAIADKLGAHDLSARATELVRWAAARSGDPLQEMMSAYVRAELFFAGQNAHTGLRVIDRATGGSAPAASGSPQAAIHGALHMRGAVLAARAGLHEEATDRIAAARAAAHGMPDGIYYGTAFGPGSVRIHELALAVEGGDTARALELAARWQPPRSVPAERRSHFHIEAARAYCRVGRNDDALTELWNARGAAPQHTRCSRFVTETTSALIRRSRTPPSGLLQFSRWIGIL